MGQKSWDTEALGVQFADGVTAVMAYNDKTCKQDPYSNEITGTGCVSMIYDTSGYSSPNTTGKDVRGLNSVVNSCVFKSNSICYGTVFKPEIISTAECVKYYNQGIGAYCRSTAIVQREHSWPTAYMTCANQGLRLPTEAELFQLGKYIYNANVRPHQTTDLTFDKDRAGLLGFKNPNILIYDDGTNYYGNYAVYFGENMIKQNAPGSYYSCGDGRDNSMDSYQCQVSNAMGLCVGDK